MITVDEFVAAMIEAEKFDIPIRLADAPQDDTLNSFKRVLSAEMFDPRKIVQGSSLLVRVHFFLDNFSHPVASLLYEHLELQVLY